MKLTVPETQPYILSTIYYVESDSVPGDKHIVVRNQGTLFCDCGDFMIRKLPLFGTSAFSLCKHGRYVQDNRFPDPKKFAVFAILSNGSANRSYDIRGEFNSYQEAASALKDHERINGRLTGIGMYREVREIK